MLKLERHDYIINKLNDERRIISKKLSSELDVSEDTIRRDLKELETAGKLKRVHSGAVHLGPPVTSFDKRQNTNIELKQKLAKIALKYLREDSVILIDSSSSNSQLIQELPLNFRCTIITNSPDIALKLINHSNIDLIMLGGTIYKQSMVALGHDTIEALSKLRVDTYILGLYNVSLHDGMSVPTKLEAQVKEKMLSIASEVLAIATSEKLETVSTHLFGSINDLNYLICDKIDHGIFEDYSNAGITVVSIENDI